MVAATSSARVFSGVVLAALAALPLSATAGDGPEVAARAEVPADRSQDGPAETAPLHRTADFVPLEGARALVYRKTSRTGPFARERTERLARRPASAEAPGPDATLRVTDSEGEYQDYGPGEGGAPAMAGQSMTEQGFTQRYVPPLPLAPAEARPGDRAEFRSKVLHRTARRTTEGEIVREVTVVGLEDVETPAGRFPGCLVLAVREENRPEVGGSFVARTEERLWLAKGLGEVKRVSDVALETFGVAWLRAKITLELEGEVGPDGAPRPIGAAGAAPEGAPSEGRGRWY